MFKTADERKAREKEITPKYVMNESEQSIRNVMASTAYVFGRNVRNAFGEWVDHIEKNPKLINDFNNRIPNNINDFWDNSVYTTYPEMLFGLTVESLPTIAYVSIYHHENHLDTFKKDSTIDERINFLKDKLKELKYALPFVLEVYSFGVHKWIYNTESGVMLQNPRAREFSNYMDDLLKTARETISEEDAVEFMNKFESPQAKKMRIFTKHAYMNNFDMYKDRLTREIGEKIKKSIKENEPLENQPDFNKSREKNNDPNWFMTWLNSVQ